MEWFVAGLVVGAGFCFFAQRAVAGKMRVRWYQWLLAVGAAAMYLLAAQNYLGFQAELEPGIANLMLALMGVPALILTALIWVVPAITARAARGRGQQSVAKAG